MMKVFFGVTLLLVVFAWLAGLRTIGLAAPEPALVAQTPPPIDVLPPAKFETATFAMG